MRIPIAIAVVLTMSAFAHAERDAPRLESAATTPFITGCALARRRAAELGSLGRLWDG